VLRRDLGAGGAAGDEVRDVAGDLLTREGLGVRVEPVLVDPDGPPSVTKKTLSPVTAGLAYWEHGSSVVGVTATVLGVRASWAWRENWVWSEKRTRLSLKGTAWCRMETFVWLTPTSIGSSSRTVVAVLGQKLKKSPALLRITFSSQRKPRRFRWKNTSLSWRPMKEGCSAPSSCPR
jgi:hypothetical protein